MRSREEINAEIESLEEQYNRSRNITERARFCAQIKELKIELGSIENCHEQKVILQNDAPAVADHKKSRKLTRGDILNTDSAFIGLI